MKKEREEVKVKLFRGQVKFANCQKQMTNLDKEIEEVLGRAVNNKDLVDLYKLDLKVVNQINTAADSNLNEFA